MTFSMLDVFLLSGLIIGTALGYRSGVQKKLFNLVLILATVVLLAQLTRPFGAWIVNDLEAPDPHGYIIAFFVLLAGTLIPGILIFRRFDNVRVNTESSAFLGGLLGLFEGALMISVVLMALSVFEAPDQESRDESLLYSPIVRVAPRTYSVLEPFIPGGPEFRAELSRMFDDKSLSQQPGAKEKL